MNIFEHESDIESLDEQELRSLYCRLFNEIAIRRDLADDYARMQAMLKRIEARLFRPKF